MKKTYAIFSVLLCLATSGLNAQVIDSLRIEVGTTGTIATKDYQPLWLVANRFAAIADEQADLSSYVRIGNRHTIGERGFYIDYGIGVYNNSHFKEVFIQEGYGKVGFRNWEIRAGRIKDIIGEMDKELSSGSLGVSGNALPIPKVGIAVTDYTNVPFTNGWLQFKGMLSHGWMGQHQYIRDAYLHEKTFYLRIGKRALKLFGGIQHYAVWGGQRTGVPKITASWQGFWDVLIAKDADDGTVNSSNIRPNRPGDHRGVLEGGIDWENENLKLHAYAQMPFEMGQGVDVRNIDRLWGLVYTTKKPDAWLRKVLLEVLYTKQMNDFYAPKYRESYYNNGVYRTGWEYEDHIVGTPLFINRVRGSNYFSSITPIDWNAPNGAIRAQGWNIINNRVVAVHTGAAYSFDLLGRSFGARTLLTFSKNYGTYSKGPFGSGKDQFYGLQEISYVTPIEGLSLSAGVGFDYGDLTKNAGFMLGVQWQFLPFQKNSMAGYNR